MSQHITSNIPETILFPRTEVRRRILIKTDSKRLQRTSPNHVQDLQLLVLIDAKIGGDNTSIQPYQHTAAYVSHMEIRKPGIARYERNLLKRRLGSHPEPYYVPRGKIIHAEHHGKGSHGTTHTRRKYIYDESPR